MIVLITGISGYIGSHIALLLAAHNYTIIGIDRVPLPAALVTNERIIFLQICISNSEKIMQLCMHYKVTALIHCAGDIAVHESVVNPSQYYENNVGATIVLLHAVRKAAISQIIFASSAAVYGIPLYTPLDEHHPQDPISPYGQTKAIIEQLLADYSAAYGMRFLAFRFFNAAGGVAGSGLAEHHIPETHLIPAVLQAIERQQPISIYGNDYDTPDGTCIRDFVHVQDIARAHLLGLQYLAHGGQSEVLNLGTEKGVTVWQVVSEIIAQLQSTVPIVYHSRRPGDPPRLVATAERAQNILGWDPQYGISTIISTAISAKSSFYDQNYLGKNIENQQ